MTIFSDPSIPKLVLLDAGEAVLLDAEDLVLLLDIGAEKNKATSRIIIANR